MSLMFYKIFRKIQSKQDNDYGDVKPVSWFILSLQSMPCSFNNSVCGIHFLLFNCVFIKSCFKYCRTGPKCQRCQIACYLHIILGWNPTGANPTLRTFASCLLKMVLLYMHFCFPHNLTIVFLTIGKIYI